MPIKPGTWPKSRAKPRRTERIVRTTVARRTDRIGRTATATRRVSAAVRSTSFRTGVTR